MICRTPGGSGIRIERARLGRSDSVCPSGKARVILTGHAFRLDNKLDLAARLSLPASSSCEALISAAWTRWHSGMANELRGAFAFALYDPARGELYAARDVFGLSPMFWRSEGDFLWLARDSRTLRSMLEEALPEDMLMLADFVAGAMLERERTFFEGVNRFPAAHWMLVRRDEIIQQRYWGLSRLAPSARSEDPVGRFRHLFDTAVANCAAERRTVLLLSGGLDSSAIAASLGPGTRALSLTYRATKDWCDDKHLTAVAEATGTIVREVPSDRHDPLRDASFWLQAVDGPYLPRGHSVSFQLLPMARQAGFDTVLSGHGGDEVVSYGFGRLNELAKQNRWWRLWLETRATAGLYGESRFALFRRYLTHIETYRRIYQRLVRDRNAATGVDHGFLDPERVEQIGGERYRLRPAAARLDHDERMLHEEALTQPLQPTSLEIFALCSHAAGVETRMPFYDRALVEFSYSLPSEWKLCDGLSRYILREAMRGSLPETVIARRDKYDFAPPFVAGLASVQDKVLDLTSPDFPAFAGLVNRPRLLEAREDFSRNGTSVRLMNAFFLWRVAMLRIWFDMAPAPPDKLELGPLQKV